MGTNYYLYETSACKECGHQAEPLHIGKSSGGWCFSLHVDADKDINSLDDWKARWENPKAVIQDEYGNIIPSEEMLRIITERSNPRTRGDNFDYTANHAEPGPNGLVRHSLGRFCIGHGDGTYDLIPGEFS